VRLDARLVTGEEMELFQTSESPIRESRAWGSLCGELRACDKQKSPLPPLENGDLAPTRREGLTKKHYKHAKPEANFMRSLPAVPEGGVHLKGMWQVCREPTSSNYHVKSDAFFHSSLTMGEDPPDAKSGEADQVSWEGSANLIPLREQDSITPLLAKLMEYFIVDPAASARLLCEGSCLSYKEVRTRRHFNGFHQDQMANSMSCLELTTAH